METINTLTREQACELAFKRGFEGETNRLCCSQETFHAVSSVLGFRNEQLFRTLSAFEGGGAVTTCGNCGAFSGALAAFSYFFGRTYEEWERKEIQCKSSDLGRMVYDRFLKEYGSVICRDILKAKFGRSFNFLDKKELAAYEELGGHAFVCPTIVGHAASWTVDILWDELPKDIDISAIPGQKASVEKLKNMRK